MLSSRRQKSQQLVDKQAKLEAKLDEDQREFNLLTGQREKLIGRQDISKHDDDLSLTSGSRSSMKISSAMKVWLQNYKHKSMN